VTPAELRMLSCPLLVVFGDAPPEKVEALRQTLESTELSHEIVTYPEAARDFFNDSRDAFDSEAAEDAWNRSLAFLDQHLEVSRSESGPVF
jgi:carboxymethylenebutenolidase